MLRARLWAGLLVQVLVLIVPSSSWAQRSVLNVDDLVESRHIAPNPDNDDFFGNPVAIHGDWMVMGAVGDDDIADDAGAAYVFKRENSVWSFHQKITASDGEQDDGFGRDVDIFEEWIVVGAFKDDDNGIDSGSAYTFKRDLNTDVWSENQKLLARDADASQSDWFGFAVAIDASMPIENPNPTLIHTVVVGAPNHVGNAPSGIQAGSIYVFQKNAQDGWETSLEPVAPEVPDSIFGENFGFAVDIRGDGIAVGTPNDKTDPNFPVVTGAAYFLQRRTIAGTWGIEWKFLASDKGNGHDFGWSVALDQDAGNNYIVAVGAPNRDAVGATYLYRGVTNLWTETILTPTDAAAQPDRYGDSVAIDIPLVLVGAPDSDPGNVVNAGALYFYQQTGPDSWWELGFRVPSDGVTSLAPISMAERIAISGYSFAATAPGFNLASGGFNQGQTYVWEDFPIFVDGFESGDVSAWSSSIP